MDSPLTTEVATVILDNAQETVTRFDDAAAGTTRIEEVWKIGSPGANESTMTQQLLQVMTVFQSNYTNWASMSNVQKDTAARNAQRAVAAIIRLYFSQLDATT